MKAQTTLFLLVMLLAASSCTIEKQLYSRGFHVEFHKRHPKADSHDTHTAQPLIEIRETEQVQISSDTITDAPIPQQKEIEVVSVKMNEKIPQATKPVSGNLKGKIASRSHRIRTSISIQTHFSESLMSKSLKENRKKYSANKSRSFDWGEFASWVLCIGGLILLIGIGAQAPGVTIGAILLGLLVVVVLILLLALLISSALGNFEWFWSGR
jgi:hypothetical protein